MELSFFYFGHLIIQLTYFFTLRTEKKAVSEPNSDTAGVNIAYSASISP